MEKNSYLNRNLFRICEKHLSPFGQKVFSTLVKLENDKQNRTNHLSQPCNYQSKRLITFNDSIIQPTIAEANNEISFIDNNKHFTNISTSDDLLKTTNFIEHTKNQTQKNMNTDKVPSSVPTFQQNSTNNLFNKTNDDKNEINEGIPWDDILDSEIFNDINEPNYNVDEKTIKTSDTNNIPEKTSLINNELQFDLILNKDVKRKRKNKLKSTEPLKKVKTSEPKVVNPKNAYRKRKYTTSVKNWLNNMHASNKFEVDDPITHDKEIHLDISKENCNETGIGTRKSPVTKANINKKTIQSQLANKDGIMKFKKPKELEVIKPIENCVNNTDTANNTITSKPSKTKDKKITKFVAPIKSQLPVKDIKFAITIVNGSNFKEYKNELDSIKDGEVIAVLMYRNGFSQLNSQHTDDTCIPEGILLQFNDTFYYLQGKINGCTEVLTNIFMSNTLVCYEGRDLLIYLKYLYDMSLTVRNVVDVKIGSNLINPDKPPENFQEVQKLLEFVPDYTIATDCTLQKAAWYLTLLKECSSKLVSILVQDGLWKVFVDIEMKLLPIIAEMQYRGVSVDTDKLKVMENILLNRMKEIEAECYKAAGRSFQINSSLQVRTLLYDELKLDTKSNIKIKETIAKGAKSTAEAMLRCLTSVHPLPKLILEYRHLHKALATFVTGIAQHVTDGVIRPTWDQTAAATGRIASNNPNLQAIPKAPFNLVLFPKDGDDASGSKDQALRFRSLYTARAGRRLLCADVRQAECRVFALRDARLRDALRHADVFLLLAAEWLKKPEAEVTSEDRERTKRIVYASLYGAGTRKLMEILNLGYDQTLSIMSSFNRTFPSLKSFGRSVISECEKRGRLSLASGRTRTFRNISSDNFADKSHAERQAVNFIIQGTAADLCKTAMILTTERLKRADPPVDAHLLLQIHDELVWEVRDTDLERAAAIIKRTMENCGRECGLDLTLAVAMYHGRSWGEMEELALDDVI